MFIDEAHAVELKAWIVKRLENISDADSDVLADYVLALIRADSPEPELRVTAIESLEDFLKNNTTSFVEEVFLAIHTKSFLPGYVHPPRLSNGSPPLPEPSTSLGAYGSSPGQVGQEGFQELRKRTFYDRQEDGDGGDPHYTRGDRQMKQIRRGVRSGRADIYGSRGGRGGFQDNGYPFQNSGSPPISQSFPGMPLPPQGLPFDATDPMTAIMAMQAMGLPPLPGMPPLPQSSSPNGHPQFGGQSSPVSRNVRRERCRDYDTQGYCARGDACPYEHGTDRLIVPGQDGLCFDSWGKILLTIATEYDPKNSLLNVGSTSPTNGHGIAQGQRGNGLDRGRGRGRGDREAP